MMNDDNGSRPQSPAWERDALAKLAGAALVEQRKGRRWAIFFRLAFLIYVLVLTALMLPDTFSSDSDSSDRHTAVVRLSGVISEQAEANAKNVNQGLRAAFADENSAAVVLKINSPGGSPVQAGQIHDEMLRLRKKYPEVPLYTVIDDVCASGGYYVAVASDLIFADKASIVGSIGVLMNGFGFVNAMDKIGVERRLLTAGAHKGFLDPFSPADGEAVTHVQSLLDDVHQQFIDVVRTGRGDRLQENPDTFSGLIWSGQQGLELGLIDQFGSLGSVARDVVEETEVVDFTVGDSPIEKFTRSLGASIGTALASRFGLSAEPTLR